MNKLFKRSLLTVLIAGSFFVQNIFGMQEQNQNTGFEFVYNNLSLLPEIKDVLVEAFSPALNTEDTTEALDQYYKEYLQRLNSSLLQNQTFLHVVKKDNKVIAFALFYPSINHREIYLQLLGVTPKFQGLRLGKGLIDSIFEQQPWINKISLCTSSEPSNIKAQMFYQRLGFQVYIKNTESILYEITKPFKSEITPIWPAPIICRDTKDIIDSKDIIRNHLIDNIDIEELDFIDMILDEELEKIQNMWQENPQTVFWKTIRNDNKVDAIALFYSTNKPDEVYLETLIINPYKDYYKVKLGEQIINSLFKECPQIRMIKTFIDTESKNYKLLKFFEDLGFVKVLDTPTKVGYEFIRR